MDFKQLRSFVSTVRTNSFTKAAAELFVSQPTISTHIRQLEEELGTQLINRTTKSLELTDRGRELYEFASSILAQRDELLARWSSKENKIIRLGVSTIPSAYILPEILPQFGEACPDVYFVIDQQDSQGVIDGMLKDQFDIGLTGMAMDDDRLIFTPFYKDRVVIITPVNDHFLDLKKRGDVPLEELLSEPMILRESGSGTQKVADRFMEGMGVPLEKLNVTARMNDQETIKKLVAGGLGISMISQRAADNLVREKRLLEFDLPSEDAGRDFYIVHRNGRTLSPALKSFTDFLTARYARR